MKLNKPAQDKVAGMIGDAAIIALAEGRLLSRDEVMQVISANPNCRCAVYSAHQIVLGKL